MGYAIALICFGSFAIGLCSGCAIMLLNIDKQGDKGIILKETTK